MRQPDHLPGGIIAAVILATLVFSTGLVFVAAFFARPHVEAGKGDRQLLPLFDTPTPGGQEIAKSKHIIDSYGWVDRERGLVHIPVEKAIDLLAGGRP